MFSKKLASLYKPRIDIANYTDARYQERVLRNEAQVRQKYREAAENQLKLSAKSKSQESVKQIERKEKEIPSTFNHQDMKINQKKPVKTLNVDKLERKASARQQVQNNAKNIPKLRMECKGKDCQDDMTLNGRNYFEMYVNQLKEDQIKVMKTTEVSKKKTVK
ncbi:hypothetical protein GQX74_003108 [Glossina fuscipes]|nr:hypothetical protein GQX74_003108 [Glossina fuscipes]